MGKQKQGGKHKKTTTKRCGLPRKVMHGTRKGRTKPYMSREFYNGSLTHMA
jgi:hypothetical protein